jgi:hypothetical protein
MLEPVEHCKNIFHPFSSPVAMAARHTLNFDIVGCVLYHYFTATYSSRTEVTNLGFFNPATAGTWKANQ